MHGGYNTKEIARVVAISDLRASKVIKSAMAKLGVSRRQEAARILAASENERVRDGPGQTQTLPPHSSIGAYRRPSEEHPLIVRDVRSSFGEMERPVDPLPRSDGGLRNELSNQQVLIRLVALIALAVLGFGVIIYASWSAAEQVAIVPRNSISN